MTQTFTLTPEQRDAFSRSGILRLEGLLSAAGVRRAREAVLRRLEPLGLWKAGAWHLDALPRPQWPDTGLKTSEVIGNRHPELAALVEESALTAAVDALLEGRAYERPGPSRRPQVLFTLPNARTWTVPPHWHTDSPRLASGQSAGVQLFAFLDASIWSSCGILAANALYFAVSATGIVAVLLESKRLFSVITWVGAAYTIWLGVRTFMSAGAAVSASAGTPASSARMFANGFVLQISKPGLLLFFVAVLPQFILPGRGVAGQVLILAVTSIFIEFVILSLYGALAAELGKLALGARFVALANRLSGLMLIVAAVALARSRL